MAYAALVSLLLTSERILESDPYFLPCTRKNFESFRESIASLISFLDDCSPICTPKINDLITKIRDAAYEAEDILESLVATHFFHKYGSDRHERFPKFPRNLEEVMKNIESVAKEVKEIQHDGSGLHERVISTTGGSSGPASRGSKSMVSLDNDLELRILEQLVGGRSTLDIIPIVGMGGVGKTTLASILFNCKLIQETFDIRGWVTISQTYDAQKIVLAILKDIGVPFDDGQKNGEQRLYQSLYGRKYLIVLDDVWSTQALDDIKRSFPENDNNSRIILTSRHMGVATYANSCSSSNEMKLLNDDSSWRLLCKEIFLQEDCPHDLVEVGKVIATRCQGLPLAISVIAGHLKKESMSEEYWKYVAENLNSVLKTTDDLILEILSLSYHYLPHHLKACFLYMGLFPRQYYEGIKVASMIKLWVAEGFVKPCGSNCVEMVAMEYLKDLIHRNLIFVRLYDSFEAPRFCEIHHLLKDVCTKEALKEKFCCVLKSRHFETFFIEESNNQRRLFVDLTSEGDENNDSEGDADAADADAHAAYADAAGNENNDSEGAADSDAHAHAAGDENNDSEGDADSDAADTDADADAHAAYADAAGDENNDSEGDADSDSDSAGDENNDSEGDADSDADAADTDAHAHAHAHAHAADAHAHAAGDENNDSEGDADTDAHAHAAYADAAGDENNDSEGDADDADGIDSYDEAEASPGTGSDDENWENDGVSEHDMLDLTRVSRDYDMINKNMINNMRKRLQRHRRPSNDFDLYDNDDDSSGESFHSSDNDDGYPCDIIRAMPDIIRAMPLIRSFVYCAGVSTSILRLISGLIKVLDVDTDEFPVQVLELVNLRHLQLESVDRVPSSISRLWNLQTLIVTGLCLIHLPLEVLEMPQLRHLQIEWCYLPNVVNFQVSETDTGDFKGLQTLSHVLNFRCTEKVLARILHLKKLKTSFESGYCSDSSFHCLNNLAHLCELESLRCEFQAKPNKTLVRNIIFPSSLKKLVLSGSGIPWEKMTIIGMLPNLEVLKLRNRAFVGSLWELNDDEFGQLKFLSIEYSSDLKEWRAEDYHFPRLRHLLLRNCEALEEIPCGIGEISTLEMIEMHGCMSSAVSSVKDMLGEDSEVILKVSNTQKPKVYP